MALFLADLNDMDVVAADIGTPFLHGKTREKLYTKGSRGCGKLEGKSLVLDRSLMVHNHWPIMSREFDWKIAPSNLCPICQQTPET